jgi:hypothetical protein
MAELSSGLSENRFLTNLQRQNPIKPDWPRKSAVAGDGHCRDRPRIDIDTPGRFPIQFVLIHGCHEVEWSPGVRIGWVGVHAEGIPALQAVCGAEYNVAGLMTLRRDKAEKRCGSADYESICLQYDIPYHEVKNINDACSIALLQAWQCDVLVVLGWGQILGPDALKHATIGVVGAHASLLPHNRGSAPVN